MTSKRLNEPAIDAVPTPMPLTTVARVDARGRVYLGKIASSIPQGTMYVIEAVADPTDPSAADAPPRTIKMRMVEVPREQDAQ